MKKFIKQTILALFLSCVFCTSALAATITPSETSITLPKGTEKFSIEVVLETDAAFAGAEFGLLPSSTDVVLDSIEFSDTLKNESTVQTIKDNCLYFGFFSNTNKFAAGKHTIATINYKYTGSSTRTIGLKESKIVTVDESSKTTNGDTSSAPFTVTIKRSGGSSGGSSGGGSGGSSSGGSSSNTNTGNDNPTDTGVQIPSTNPTYDANKFGDIANHWAKDSIEKAVANNYFNGTTETTFSPNANVTRAMAVTVLGRFAKVDATATSSSFTDVPQNAYYTGYLAWGTQKEMVKGINETQFAPEQPITREQISSMILRYLRSENIVLPTATEKIKSHSDYANISAYATESMTLCYDMGLIGGHENGQLAPQGKLTRAELAVIMLRLDDYITSIK